MATNYQPSKNIKDAHKLLQDSWPLIVADFEKEQPDYTLWITCTHRTPEEQFQLFKKGRNNLGTLENPEWEVTDAEKVVTNCDGFKKLSKHNSYPSEAIDVVVVYKDTKRTLWDTKLYKPLIKIAEKYGLVSGGSWKSFQDWPHIELKKGLVGGPGKSSAHQDQIVKNIEPPDTDKYWSEI